MLQNAIGSARFSARSAFSPPLPFHLALRVNKRLLPTQIPVWHLHYMAGKASETMKLVPSMAIPHAPLPDDICHPTAVRFLSQFSELDPATFRIIFKSTSALLL